MTNILNNKNLKHRNLNNCVKNRNFVNIQEEKLFLKPKEKQSREVN